jgi:hypothetical protein
MMSMALAGKRRRAPGKRPRSKKAPSRRDTASHYDTGPDPHCPLKPTRPALQSRFKSAPSCAPNPVRPPPAVHLCSCLSATRMPLVHA